MSKSEQTVNFTVTDEEGKGAPLTVTVKQYNYGVELLVRRNDEVATVLLDYIGGALNVFLMDDNTGEAIECAAVPLKKEEDDDE